MSHFRTALAREWASFPGDYGQKGINGGMYPGQRASIGRDKLTERAQRWLDEREGRVAKRPGEPADGAGFSARMKAMRDFEKGEGGVAERYRARVGEAAKQREGLKAGARPPMMDALRSGVKGATPRVDANGTVAITIDRPGPDTRVKTVTEGTLFKDVRLNGGRRMVRASEDN